MSEVSTPDYRALLYRAGVAQISDEDIADLAPGLMAIDTKIALLRKVAAGDRQPLPDPLDPIAAKGASNG
jgi:hypothetical protein